MSSLLLSIGLLLSGQIAGQTTIEEAWKKEQSDRSKYNQILYNPKATPDALRAALAQAEEVKKWCLSDGIRDLKNPQGTRLLYFQRNDILVDEIGGYARLKDTKEVRRCLSELRDSLIAPDYWAQGKELGTFSLYANIVRNNEEVAKLLPDPEIEAILSDLQRRDPDRFFRGVPYATEDTDKISAAERVAGLSMIWSEAKYNFANFDLVPNLDWDACYQKFLPLVASARSRYDYYNLLREFIAQLRDSHTDVALPQSLREREETRPALPTKLIEGKVVVWKEPSSDFKKLGFQLGDVVESIDGVDAVKYGQEKWGRRASSSTLQDLQMRLYTYMLLRGPQGKAIKLGVANSDGQTRTISVPRTDKLKGTPLPPYEFRLLSGGTAYFAFNTCSNDQPSDAFAKVLPEIVKAGRLIIDCRMNDGGSSDVGYSILRHLIDKQVQVNQWQTRDYRASFRAWNSVTPPFKDTSAVDPTPPLFSGPVVVLASARTFSAGEDFVAAFKMSKRGPTIGEPTGGSTGQPLVFQLPGGGSARICTKRDRMGDGTEFVGIGILPDIRADLTIESIRKGTDPGIEAALSYFAKK